MEKGEGETKSTYIFESCNMPNSPLT